MFLFHRIVQGVGYRFATVNQANQLGISGWVRNLPDQRVEAVFEGTPEAVTGMISWCKQGPLGAVVNSVIVEYEEVEGLPRFEIKR
ncbi:Acylphosphatase [Crinalium epipsammum PCC 9333]|uniref:acylphosphatase n=1 Tax=Crinalium epipsammum PCC 9333 TaxID=1173022 RepID=K9VUF5_9CYAN|nr:Acylphosphatase [Crinalium epipsammum PCC 9333]